LVARSPHISKATLGTTDVFLLFRCTQAVSARNVGDPICGGLTQGYRWVSHFEFRSVMRLGTCS